MIPDYTPLYAALRSVGLGDWAEVLAAQVRDVFAGTKDGNLPRWLGALERMPRVTTADVDFRADAVRVGRPSEISPRDKARLGEGLRALCPWRKGPFSLFGIEIDAEWRSYQKWERLWRRIDPLKERLVLDVGSNNGYYAWRMAGLEARLVVGIDPTFLYVLQYHAVARCLRSFQGVSVLPLGIDDMPEALEAFDTVFSMGLLYHRRAPLDHLLRLRSFLRPGGQLVLETLVIEGGPAEVLAPVGRYAKMPNVWFIPSNATLAYWLKRVGFGDIECLGAHYTSQEEQRATEWMRFQSLADFLDPHDPRRTIEGYPAPRRAIFLARK